jgi:drug/metabolite transporter (DMT)-like permease
VKRYKNAVLPWLILFILTLVWGSSFILIKKGLVYFTSTQVGAMRIAISFIFLLPFALARLRRVARNEWKHLIVVGLVGSGLPAFLFARAQTGLDSSMAGILNSLTPLFTLLTGVVFFSARSRWQSIAGVVIGLAGAIGLISVGGGHSFEFNMKYAVYVILATICYAINVNIIKYRLMRLDAITITSMSFIFIGVPVLVHLFLFTDFVARLGSEEGSWLGLLYIAILAVVGTGLALMLFNALVKIASPVFASSVTYTIPLVAVSWGVLDGEPLSWSAGIWIALILTGVFLVNKKERKSKMR